MLQMQNATHKSVMQTLEEIQIEKQPVQFSVKFDLVQSLLANQSGYYNQRDHLNLMKDIMANFHNIKLNQFDKCKLLDILTSQLLKLNVQYSIQMKLIDLYISINYQSKSADKILRQNLLYLQQATTNLAQNQEYVLLKQKHHEALVLIDKLIQITNKSNLGWKTSQLMSHFFFQISVPEHKEQIQNVLVKYINALNEALISPIKNNFQKKFMHYLLDEMRQKEIFEGKDADENFKELLSFTEKVLLKFPHVAENLVNVLNAYKRQNNQEEIKINFNILSETTQPKIKEVISNFMKTRDVQIDLLRESIDNYQASSLDLQALIEFSSAIYPLDQQLIQDAIENAKIEDTQKEANTLMLLNKLMNQQENITPNEIDTFIRNLRNSKNLSQIQIQRAKQIIFILELFQEVEYAGEIENIIDNHQQRTLESSDLYQRPRLRGSGTKFISVLNAFNQTHTIESMTDLYKQLEKFAPIETISLQSRDKNENLYFYLMNHYDIYKVQEDSASEVEYLLPNALNFTKSIVEDFIGEGHKLIIADEFQSFRDKKLMIRTDLKKEEFSEYNHFIL